MPGRHTQGPIDDSHCRRCQNEESTIKVRNEQLCKTCFFKYVSTKVVKRMESFRVRHSEPDHERTLLLALSLGAGSIALLHVLSQHLKGQVEKTGRTGFKLHALHIVEMSSTTESARNNALENVKNLYPEHRYSHSLLSEISSCEEISRLFNQDGARDSKEHVATKQTEALDQLLAATGSATSRADVKEILKKKLIVQFARDHDCEAVLWGDSTTRLAERTLAETAKGRGTSLPWIVADGESPHGIPTYYPMRDLLGKEIAAFVSMVEPPLNSLIRADDVKSVVSTRNTTIDDLMRQYFDSVERNYPSIVANVVRTAGKLQAVPLSEVEKQCELCEMPLDGQSPDKSRLCYGCIRTIPQTAR